MFNSVAQLFDAIDGHFYSDHKRRYPLVFAQEMRQVEGWFKGELMFLFDSLRQSGQLQDWQSEVDVPLTGLKKIDFRVAIQGSPLYIECKALYVGRQGNSTVTLPFYFGKGYIDEDVRKLARIGDGYCLLFIYPAPLPVVWEQTLAKYVTRVAPIGVANCGNGPELGSSLYLAKLRIVCESPLPIDHLLTWPQKG